MHTPLARVVLSEVKPSSCPIRARLSRAPPPGRGAPLTLNPPRPRRPGGGGKAQLPSGPLIMSLQVSRSLRVVAYSLRTALAFCSPRPWAPSAAAVRTLRTGSALLSGKCRARGHRSCPPHSQASWPDRPITLPALLALGILVLWPFSLSRRESTGANFEPGVERWRWEGRTAGPQVNRPAIRAWMSLLLGAPRP